MIGNNGKKLGIEKLNNGQGFHYEDLWRVFRIMAEFVEGFETMNKIGRAVSIFGSARTDPEDQYYKLAKELAEELGETQICGDNRRRAWDYGGGQSWCIAG